MKPIRTWILIADGRRARVLLHEGGNRPVRALDDMRFEVDLAPSRDLLSDRPGRVQESGAPTRHAIELPSDPHREQKRAFAKMLASRLDQELDTKSFDRLVVVAPPTTLGDLREYFSKRLASTIRAEVTKDLTKTPDSEVMEHLGEALGG
jgi:protein required for attachment to host cells